MNMDKFSEMMQKMMAMSEADRTAMIEKNKAICICGRCPSYDNCAKGKKELLFCATGRSACRLTKNTCICPYCPVTPMIGLTHEYYCIIGSESEQREM
jgi:Protein of unknown function (DUF2769)